MTKPRTGSPRTRAFVHRRLLMTIARHGIAPRRWIVAMLAVASCAILAVRVEGADRVALRQSAYLLLDPRVVESAQNVELRLGAVAKHSANPLFAEEKPWEVRFDNVYANVIYDEEEGLFKCWYSPYIVDEATSKTPRRQRASKEYRPTPPREMALCYAYSKDGVHWTKPELGVIDFGGDKRNNLVMRTVHGACVLKQPSDPDPARRYKLFAGSQAPGQKRYMIVAFSGDGIHWSSPTPCHAIESTGDTHNGAIWAPGLERFVGFTREFRDQRLVTRTESRDFVHWTKSVEVLRGEPQRQTYAMQVFPTHGIYLGLVAVLDTRTDRVHGELAVSDDTVHWRRVCHGTSLVANSDRRGAYDYGCVYMAKPIVRGENVWIYYGASNGPHGGWRDSYLALATMKRDRWAGYVNSPSAGPSGSSIGQIRTAPIVCRGSKLRVNVVAPHGAVRVGIVGEKKLTVEDCRPISGDSSAAEVQWTSGADLSRLVDKPVQLDIRIDNGAAYALEFCD